MEENIFTADEAAERLRISRRRLITFGRKLGAVSVIGRTYLFSDSDIQQIWEAMRVEPGRALERVQSAHDREIQAKALEFLNRKPKRRRAGT